MASTTSGSGDTGAIHTQDGNAAGQVNAARLGFLLNGGPGITITSIGSQNIVSTSVLGNGNTTTLNTNQISSNTGAVSNTGTVIVTQP